MQISMAFFGFWSIIICISNLHLSPLDVDSYYSKCCKCQMSLINILRVIIAATSTPCIIVFQKIKFLLSQF